MKINQSNLLNQLASEQLNQKDAKSDKNRLSNRGKEVSASFDDIYKQSKMGKETSFSYNNPLTVNSVAVNQLMQEGEDLLGSVRDLVRDFLERQGITIDQLNSGEIGDLKIDDITQEKARELISPGGELSAENVSDRIVSFAIAGFGGDKGKIEIIKSAIDQGFTEAEKLLGELADVSKQTYELIQQKLDAWVNDGESSEVDITQ